MVMRAASLLCSLPGKFCTLRRLFASPAAGLRDSKQIAACLTAFFRLATKNFGLLHNLIAKPTIINLRWHAQASNSIWLTVTCKRFHS